MDSNEDTCLERLTHSVLATKSPLNPSFVGVEIRLGDGDGIWHLALSGVIHGDSFCSSAVAGRFLFFLVRHVHQSMLRQQLGRL